jgi:hypothetical protein
MAIDPKKLVQKIYLDVNAFRFQTPFAMSVTGPSQVGKSEFIYSLIKFREVLFTSKFYRIIYCQPESLFSHSNPIFQKIKSEFPTAELVFGVPKLNELQLEQNTLPCLLILDDLMTSVLNSEHMKQLFCVQVHHCNISCIFTSQNYFSPSRFGKTISRNVHYKVLFFNRIELVELRHISIQITPKCPNFLYSSFKFLQKTYPFEYSHYIIIDGHSRSKMSDMHVRTHIFPEKDGEIRPIVFFPNDCSDSK